MLSGSKNIYRKKTHEWVPLLSFGSGRTRTSADGWHTYPYQLSELRTMGVRYRDPNGVVVNNQVAYRRENGVYTNYNTQAGFVCDIKFDPSKLVAIWYRYSNVNAILVPFNEMTALRAISFREHMIHFGDADLSQNPKFAYLEISKGGSMDSIVFHPDAPLKHVYLTGCSVTTAVVDACVEQCYLHRNTPAPGQNLRSFISQWVGYSPSLQPKVDELVNSYGWSFST